MTPLPTSLRSLLETTVKEARTVAEKGARQALEALSVDRRDPHASMPQEAKALRRRLRAHGRQLGDTRDTADGRQTIHRLLREVAYEHWHRMLFARFLAENQLLIEPESGVAITMEECQELARERGDDPWALAASFAQGMLPGIFRADDPALAVTLPPETRQALQRLVADLPTPVFTHDDALGWTYQFWQAAEKDAVNARVKSGEKITGETLPAVTQLFTEPYMVHFLLDNTFGAWHAGKVLRSEDREGAADEGELRRSVRLRPLGGYDFEYLRFVREPDGEAEGKPGPWRPAAGTFEGWPREARHLKVLDPCCGSGHFLVAALQILVRLRMQEEELDAPAAVRGVLADNLFGLELDPRCTQIAAFNLAFTAWKLAGGTIDLPPLGVACSGIGPQASKEEWLSLAEEVAAAGGMPGSRNLFGNEDTLLSAGVRGGLEALYDLFQQAPELGSLIDPRGADGSQRDAFREDFSALGPLLDAVMRRETRDDEDLERAVAARGMAEAARILAGPEEGYTLVITNVPYLGRGSQTRSLREWTDRRHRDARTDLATVFTSRALAWVTHERSSTSAGTAAIVTPQGWLYQPSYGSFRRRLRRDFRFEAIARLGPGAFETIGGEVVSVSLAIVSGHRPDPLHRFVALDVSPHPSPPLKASGLRGSAEVPGREGEDASLASPPLLSVPQAGGSDRITLSATRTSRRLVDYALSGEGLSTGDGQRFLARLWELPALGRWEPIQSDPGPSGAYGGVSYIVDWDRGEGELATSPAARIQGNVGWGARGIAVSEMNHLRAVLHLGVKHDKTMGVIVAKLPELLPAVWAFCSSSEYATQVRDHDRGLKVSPSSLTAVPFDLAHWQKVAAEQYPDGLPEPYSDDPTQWLFHGHPAQAESGTELHVAVARLLGYRWPAELDPEMRLSEEARALVARSSALHDLGLADKDGIVCLPSIRGESAAVDRLRTLLAGAFGPRWSPARERELLAATASAPHGSGRPERSLDAWLRERFFEEHCKLFQHRPFIWHVWDGHPGGFSALVNYHRLAGSDHLGRRTLESLTFTYLGEWIDRQRAGQQEGHEGADARLAAALRLRGQLEKILAGEPPYDLFVRWKPLHQQPLGWEPDINDGVRLNIRPFLRAEDVGRKDAGILRWKPNVKWGKDRGKEPESLRPREDFPWFWGCDPEAHLNHGTDFGAGTGGAPAGEEFDGARWNDLHYTRAAREAARRRATGGSAS